ncbi:E3 ubiquitin-protein ligase RING1 isoform 1-T1 [Vipera latastei]
MASLVPSRSRLLGLGGSSGPLSYSEPSFLSFAGFVSGAAHTRVHGHRRVNRRPGGFPLRSPPPPFPLAPPQGCHGRPSQRTDRQQDLGAQPLRASPDPPGGHHGRDGDRRVPPQPAQRADVPHLPGHAQAHHDHQGVPAPLLLRLHRHRPAQREQGVPHLPEEAGLQALPPAGPQLRRPDLQDLPQPGRVRGPPGPGAGQAEPAPQPAGPAQQHGGGAQDAGHEPGPTGPQAPPGVGQQHLQRGGGQLRQPLPPQQRLGAQPAGSRAQLQALQGLRRVLRRTRDFPRGRAGQPRTRHRGRHQRDRAGLPAPPAAGGEGGLLPDQVRQDHGQRHGGPPLQIPGPAHRPGGGGPRPGPRAPRPGRREREAVHDLHHHGGRGLHDAERVCDAGAGEREVLEAEQAAGAVLRPHQGAEITVGGALRPDGQQWGGCCGGATPLPLREDASAAVRGRWGRGRGALAFFPVPPSAGGGDSCSPRPSPPVGRGGGATGGGCRGLFSAFLQMFSWN